MKFPNIFIIILNWNGREDTLECIESVQNIDYPNFTVVIVDNGSSDDSVKAIHEKFPEISVLETGKNLGFAGGNNVGIRYALQKGAESILLLNNDTIVKRDILINFVSAVMFAGESGIFGAKIFSYSQPDKIWYAGMKWIKETSNFVHSGCGSIENRPDFNSVIETDYICGCALFVSASVLNQIGLFDERFFLLFEETDLCYRAKKMGIKSFLVPEAKVWHKISNSLGGECSALYSYYYIRNKLLWAEKNLTLQERLRLYRHVLSELFRCFTPPRLGRRGDRKDLSYRSRWNGLIEYKGTLVRKYQKSSNKAKLLGTLDYVLRRFGNCRESLRSPKK